ncbi:Fc.00g114450.m01.CDS01 [Cosmosporella sp. VM-42]
MSLATLPSAGENGEEYGRIEKNLSFRVFDSVDLESSNEETRRRVPSLESLSDRNIRLIQSWTQDCKANHSKCATDSSATRWLPTRLIHFDDSGSESLHLLETAKLSSKQKTSADYIALSHMWGDMSVSPPFRTTKSNYAALVAKIDVDVLPRNFVEALRVCFELGIQYLWIDSLCIIQDDSGDWGREAALMHMVYKHAELTIAATSAKSAHDGFLARDTYLSRAVKLQYSQDHGPTRSMVLTPYDDIETGSRWGDIEGSLWNTRGWTMQERSLSTRIVHFCKNKLYFECRTCLKSEEGEPVKFRPSDRFVMWPRATSEGKQSNDMSLPKEELRQRWRVAIVEYSRRSLTHGSDKLRAIESLATEMGASIFSLSSPEDTTQEADEYVPFAGMWKENLYRELLWYVERGARVRPPAHDKRNVPTWSWASLDVHLGFSIGDRTPPNNPLTLAKTGANETNMPPTSSASTNSAGWETGKNPFRVLGLGKTYDDYSPVKLENFIEIQALSRRISQIARVENTGSYMDYVERIALPFNLLVHRASGESVTFAHAALDMDNKDNMIWDTKPLMYAHVNSEQRPSGLVLQRKDKATPKERDVWIRVGVASMFHKKGQPILDPPFAENALPDSIIIV